MAGQRDRSGRGYSGVRQPMRSEDGGTSLAHGCSTGRGGRSTEDPQHRHRVRVEIELHVGRLCIFIYLPKSCYLRR